MVLHVRYNSFYISVPSSAKQQREMTNFSLSEARELRRLFFLTDPISNLLRSLRFTFVKALTVINKEMTKVIPLKLFYYQTFFETWRS